MKVEQLVSFEDAPGVPEFVLVRFRGQLSFDEQAAWQHLAVTCGGGVVKPQVATELLAKATAPGEAAYFTPQADAVLPLTVRVPRKLRGQITPAWLETTLQTELER